MLLKRGARVLSLGVPATFTNVQQVGQSLQFTCARGGRPVPCVFLC